jgi:DNA-binding MarR family transcriptional regulator
LAVVNRYSGLSSAELARHFFVTPQTIGPILAQLEKRDLLVREENPENRRLLSISLTAAGHALLLKCNAEIQDIESIIFRDFSDDSLEELRGYLKGLYARCREQRR